MARFKVKPMVIEAEQVTRDNPRPYEKDGAIHRGDAAALSARLWYGSGDINYKLNDYIVKREDGSFYPVPRAEFEAYYEPEG